MTASVPAADHPPVRTPPRAIRTVRATDRGAVLAVVGAVDLFPAEELVEVEPMLDAFLAGDAGPDDRRATDEAAPGPRGRLLRAGDDKVIFWESPASSPGVDRSR